MQLVTVTMRVAVVDNASEDSIIAGIMGLQKAAEVMARRTYTGSMSDTEIAQIVEPLYANTRLTGWSVRSVDPVVLSK